MSEKDKLQNIIGECIEFIKNNQSVNTTGWTAEDWGRNTREKINAQARWIAAENRLREIIHEEAKAEFSTPPGDTHG